MTQIKYATAIAILALAVFSTQIRGQPVVCAPPPTDPCEKSNCMLIHDEWDVGVEPNGRIYLNGEVVSRNKLKQYAVDWAKDGTWDIVVYKGINTKPAQINSIVTMLRKAGVKTGISCEALQR